MVCPTGLLHAHDVNVCLLAVPLLQARWLSEKFLEADNAAMLDGAFRSQPSGLKNLQGTMPDEALAWYRAALCQPGAATGMLNWYRAFMEFVTVSDPADPAWRWVEVNFG